MLILDAPPLKEWEKFQSGARTGSGVLDLVRRWERARALGATPDGHYPEGIGSGELTQRRERLEDIFREAYQVLDRSTERLASRGVVALLADTDGVVLTSHGGGRFARAANRTRLVEGARWDEATRGTNAIGTALAERTSIVVRGCAHFERATHPLFCYASPVRDPAGKVVAVLDVTGPLNEDDEAFGLVVSTTCSAVEGILRTQAYATALPGGLRIIERILGRTSTGALLVEAPGVLRLANDYARTLLGLSVEECEGRNIESLFGIPYAALRDESIRSRGAPLRISTDNVRCTAEIEPLFLSPEKPFALLIYIEALRPFAARPQAHETPRRFPSLAPEMTSLRGSDPAVALARMRATELGATSAPVYIWGPRGSGKKRLARTIHDASVRRDEPFFVLDAGREEDLEAILFGGQKRAKETAMDPPKSPIKKKAQRIAASDTRDARDDHDPVGLLDQLGGGTLYVERVSELPKVLRTKLETLIDRGLYRRLGEVRDRRADVRVILSGELALSKLPLSLRSKLAIDSELSLPALRDRTDKVELAQIALREGEPEEDSWELADDARAWVGKHDWPGNLEELFELVRYAKTLAGQSFHVTARELQAARARVSIHTRSL